MQRPPARNFEDLIVWQKAHRWVLDIDGYTYGFPREERYGLCTQFRRAAVSIPANIAEGFKKRGTADKFRFMNIAQGSAEECRYYLILARDLGYGQTGTLREGLLDVTRLLESYAGSLRGSTRTGRGLE